MSTSKSYFVSQDNVTIPAGVTVFSLSQDVSDGFGASVMVLLTNGPQGPTAAPACQLQASNDEINWYDLDAPIQGSTADGEITSEIVLVPTHVQYFRTKCGGNLSYDVTLRVEWSETTEV